MVFEGLLGFVRAYQGLWLKVFGVGGLGSRVHGSGFRVQRLRFRVSWSVFRVCRV